MRCLACLCELLLETVRGAMLAKHGPSLVEHLLMHQDRDEQVGRVMPARALFAPQPSVEGLQRPIASLFARKLTDSLVQLEAWLFFECAPEMRLGVPAATGLHQ